MHRVDVRPSPLTRSPAHPLASPPLPRAALGSALPAALLALQACSTAPRGVQEAQLSDATTAVDAAVQLQRVLKTP